MTEFTYIPHMATDLPESHDWARTLGIEVTIPAIVEQCGLGNLDPQHAPNALANAPAAIEVALAWDLPGAGAHLVTVRPDLDALGAMAVLEFRAKGACMNNEMRRRIEMVAAADRFARGQWPGPRPLPATVVEVLQVAGGEELALLNACAFDAEHSLTEREKRILHWLRDGILPVNYRRDLERQANTLLMSLWLGTTRVCTSLDGRIATVVSDHPQALRLGYRLAPVVVALNPSQCFPGRKVGPKFTVARWGEGDCDLHAVGQRLGELEPGWGGQAGIKGSPQTAPSHLKLEKVVDLVATGLPDLPEREERA